MTGISKRQAECYEICNRITILTESFIPQEPIASLISKYKKWQNSSQVLVEHEHSARICFLSMHATPRAFRIMCLPGFIKKIHCGESSEQPSFHKNTPIFGCTLSFHILSLTDFCSVHIPLYFTAGHKTNFTENFLKEAWS